MKLVNVRERISYWRGSLRKTEPAKEKKGKGTHPLPFSCALFFLA